MTIFNGITRHHSYLSEGRISGGTHDGRSRMSQVSDGGSFDEKEDPDAIVDHAMVDQMENFDGVSDGDAGGINGNEGVGTALREGGQGELSISSNKLSDKKTSVSDGDAGGINHNDGGTALQGEGNVKMSKSFNKLSDAKLSAYTASAGTKGKMRHTLQLPLRRISSTNTFENLKLRGSLSSSYLSQTSSLLSQQGSCDEDKPENFEKQYARRVSASSKEPLISSPSYSGLEKQEDPLIPCEAVSVSEREPLKSSSPFSSEEKQDNFENQGLIVSQVHSVEDPPEQRAGEVENKKLETSETPAHHHLWRRFSLSPVIARRKISQLLSVVPAVMARKKAASFSNVESLKPRGCSFPSNSTALYPPSPPLLSPPLPCQPSSTTSADKAASRKCRECGQKNNRRVFYMGDADLHGFDPDSIDMVKVRFYKISSSLPIFFLKTHHLVRTQRYLDVFSPSITSDDVV